MIDKKIKIFIKAAISLLVLFFILHSIDFYRLVVVLKNVNLYYLFFSVVIIYIGIIVSSIKWKILLRKQNIEVSLGKSCSAYYSGMFFNTFLPTVIGGDFVRAKIVSNDGAPFEKTLASIFFDRCLGFFALSCLSFAGAVAGTKFDYPPKIIILAILIFVVVLGFFFLFFLTRNSLRLRDYLTRGKFRSTLLKYYEAMTVYKDFSKDIFFALVLSFVFQFLSILYTFFIISALGVQLSIWFVFLLYSITTLFIMLPISISGIGLREASFVFFFISIGLSSTLAVAAAFLSFSILVIINSLGGIVFILKK